MGRGFVKVTMLSMRYESPPFLYRRGYVLLVFFAVLSFSRLVHAQNISGAVNTYVHVIALDTCLNTATVVSTSGFSVGDRVLVIQMKGATIDTTNTANYGTILNMGSAGLMEIATIQAMPNLFTILFRDKLLNAYDAADGAVQLVRIPQYTDVTVTDTLRSDPWNPITGTGGVLILEASGTLTIHAPIDVSGLGFYGGGASANGTSPTSELDYVADACTTWEGANKGESIASNLRYGEFCEGCRGAPANGGGGGNSHNAGGAGGAGSAGGGRGGDQTDAPGFGRMPIGGEPGKPIPWIPNRIFMGGGGGGGHQNDAQGTNGGSGGGIVILKATQITSDSEFIFANGTSPGIYWAGNHTLLVPDTAHSDGAGGGGGGGSIWLDAQTIVATGGHVNALNCSAVGGTGGFTDAQNGPFSFGPGGGGGGGLIALKPGMVGSVLNDLRGGDAGNLVHSTNSSTNNLAYGAGDGMFGASEVTLNIPESTIPYAAPIVLKDSFTICKGDSVTLAASGGDSYLWSPASGMNNPTSDSSVVAPTSTTLYTVLITKGSCSVTDTVNVIVAPLPLASFSGPLTPCSGNTDTYSISPQAGITYRWSATGGTPASGAGDSIQITWNNAGTYTVSLVASNGQCSDSTFQQVIVAAPITPLIQASKLVLVNPGDTSVLSLVGIYSLYKWSNGDTTSTITVDSAGTYAVTVVDANGCSGMDLVQINYPAGVSSVELGVADISAKPGDHVILPVNIIAAQNLGAARVTGFSYTIHFDQSLLEPLDPAITSTFRNGQRYVTKHGTISNQLSTNSLDQIEFLAALGDSTETQIVFDTVVWSSANPIATKLDAGHFTLLGVCPAGGNRLFFENGTVAINDVHPNPVSSTAVADYSLVEPGVTTLEVLDMLGRNVLTIASGDAKAGDYHAAFDASLLPNGMYNLILRTPTQIFTRHMEVYH